MKNKKKWFVIEVTDNADHKLGDVERQIQRALNVGLGPLQFDLVARVVESLEDEQDQTLTDWNEF